MYVWNFQPSFWLQWDLCPLDCHCKRGRKGKTEPFFNFNCISGFEISFRYCKMHCIVTHIQISTSLHFQFKEAAKVVNLQGLYLTKVFLYICSSYNVERGVCNDSWCVYLTHHTTIPIDSWLYVNKLFYSFWYARAVCQMFSRCAQVWFYLHIKTISQCLQQLGDKQVQTATLSHCSVWFLNNCFYSLLRNRTLLVYIN